MDQEKERDQLKRFYGTNFVLTSLAVVGVVAALNLYAGHHQKEFDFTKGKIYAFSDQTKKVLDHLDADLRAEFYGDPGTREKFTPLLEKYAQLSPRFKLEFVDIYKEQTRTKAAGVKKLGTLALSYHDRAIKVEEPSEANITNAILKIEKDKKSTVCMLIGHGEASVEDITQNGLQALKSALQDQAYQVKEFALTQKASLQGCDSVAMVGTHGSFFPNEIKVLGDYLNNGGRAVFALEAALKAKDEVAGEYRQWLSSWGIEVKNGLAVDPESRKLGVDASLVMINLYNPHHPVTKGFLQPTYLPFTRPLEAKMTAGQGISVEALAKSGDEAWSETDIDSFVKGAAKFNLSSDLKGPLTVAVAAHGKLKTSDAARESRIVVLGSSQFVNNQYSRVGGNLDLFMNAISWVIEDESLISIRPKEDVQGKVELPEKDSVTVFWLIVIAIPAAFALMGFLVWLRRKHL